jgi:hypothetical protein
VDQPSPETEARKFMERYRSLLETSMEDLENQTDFDLSRGALRVELALTLKPLADAKVQYAAQRLKWSLWDAYADTLGGRSDLVRQWGKTPNARALEAQAASDEAGALVQELESDEEIRAALALLDVFTRTEPPGETPVGGLT